LSSDNIRPRLLEASEGGEIKVISNEPDPLTGHRSQVYAHPAQALVLRERAKLEIKRAALGKAMP
jgi:hypothetical protein